MSEKTANLYRMVLPDQVCPSGLKSKGLLERKGFQVIDHVLTTRAEVDAFKAQQGVQTTPQIFIDGARVGGFDDLNSYFGGSVKQAGSTTYAPVIALFSVAALLAIILTFLVHDVLFKGQTVGWFISISMVLLGLQKLQDIDRFATMFLTYDVLAQKCARYGYIYPFVETGAGLLMLAGVLTWLSAPAALIVASIGAFSVLKAVYLDKRNLKCACVGGDSKVPLGFVSLTENLMMMGMAIWMLSQM